MRYKVLLLSLLGFIVLAPLLPQGRFGELLFGGLFLLVIASASVNLQSHPIARAALLLFGSFSLVFGIVLHYGLAFTLLSRVTMFLFFASAIWIFAKDVFNKNHAQKDHLYGAIIIYFLIGISYALAFQFLQLLHPQELIISATGLPVSDPFDSYYFSFITLSTVGFGDIVAKGQFAKMISMFESITGLFYFAILVSSLIGIVQSKSQS